MLPFKFVRKLLIGIKLFVSISVRRSLSGLAGLLAVLIVKDPIHPAAWVRAGKELRPPSLTSYWLNDSKAER